MPGTSDDRVPSGLSVALPGTAPCPRASPGTEPLQVTVVAADAQLRRRLLDALAATADVEVVGWAESAQALAALDRSAGAGVVLHVVPSDGEPVVRRPRVDLAARQVDVLVAYAAGNELLGVVARTLGMSAETVKTHLRRIRRKYADAGRPAPTRRDLYVRAVEDGYLSPPS